MSRTRPASFFTFASLIIFVCHLVSPLFLGYRAVYAAPEPPEIAADSYLLADLKTGRVFMAKDVDTPQVPASLTKIMTLYIVFDEISQGRLAFDGEVSISEEAWRTEGSKMFVLVGTTVRVDQLIQGITVASGNDACVALAEHISGSVTSFVDRMNRQAQELGLTTAHFVDPHGISDDNRISARDLFTLVNAYITRYPEALQFHAIKEFTYAPPGDKPITQFNRNRLLWSYPGVYGLKTGFTTRAGFNLVALAERDGLSTVAIILGSARGKSIDEGERERTALATSMLDYVYKNFSYVEVAEPNANLGRVRVWKGKGKWAEGIAPTGLGATVEKGQEDSLSYQVVFDTDLEAPVHKGMKIGEVVFTCDGEEVGRADLVAKAEVPRGNIFRVIWDSIARSILKAFGKA
ncbi:MAG: D-alanyl-D-alanine carboxypeptidase family protein [Bacillota bacterium]|jgi:D-alanyl-D-alanine carboxypeptidase (penicillin-binding protein 5/6)